MTICTPFSLFRPLLTLLLIWQLAYTAGAQDTVYYNLGSPYHTVYTHLDNLQPKNYHPLVAGKAFDQSKITKKQAARLAVKLKQIWDGEGILIPVDIFPQEPNYLDSLTGQSIYIVDPEYPEIFLKKIDQRWLYPPSTFPAIEQIHSKIYPFGADLLVNLLPRGIGNEQLWRIKVWQLVGVMLFLIIGYVLFKFFTLIFDRFLVRLARRLGYTEIVELFVLWLVLLPMLQLPVEVSQYLVTGLKAVMPFFGVMIFYSMVDVFSLYLDRLAKRTDSTMDDQLIPIIRRSLKIVVIVIGVLFILHNLDVNITALLAGLSIGGLALALAAQETLKNFFGSIMIFLDRPFQVGDWISSDGIDGTVEEVGFRSTLVRTFRNSLTSIPNGRLADHTIDNHGLRVYRRFNTHIAITYDTPPAVITTFVEGLKKIVTDHPDTRKDYFEIHLHEMGSSSLNILFYIFFQVPTWTDELICRHQVLLQVLRLAEALGVRFAFPTQTLHMETFPGQNSLTPESLEDMETLRKKLDDFFASQPKN
jgi:MscS family membrane protein